MQILLGNGLAPTLRDDFIAKAASHPDLQILPASIGKFKSSEAFSEIRKKPSEPLVIMQSLGAINGTSTNDLAMQLAFTIATATRNGAGPIWVIEPFCGYSREDRSRPDHMDSIGLDDFTDILKHKGALGFSTIELHSKAGLKILSDHFGAEQTYNLAPTDLLVGDILGHVGPGKIVVGGPDEGANERADAVARRLGAEKFLIRKRHVGVNTTEVTSFEGNVDGRQTVTVDDMFDTCGTAMNAQQRLAEQGAVFRLVEGAHPIFSNGAMQDVFTAKTKDGDNLISQMAFTDTIDVGAKIADLKTQFGNHEVDARIRVLHTGSMLFDHVVRDILPHPGMMQPGMK